MRWAADINGCILRTNFNENKLIERKRCIYSNFISQSNVIINIINDDWLINKKYLIQN